MTQRQPFSTVASVWMLRGSATFVDDAERLLTPGELMLMPPGVRHSFRWDTEHPSRHGYVHFGYASAARSSRLLEPLVFKIYLAALPQWHSSTFDAHVRKPWSYARI
jgi:hypothetical protein